MRTARAAAAERRRQVSLLYVRCPSGFNGVACHVSTHETNTNIVLNPHTHKTKRGKVMPEGERRLGGAGGAGPEPLSSKVRYAWARPSRTRTCLHPPTHPINHLHRRHPSDAPPSRHCLGRRPSESKSAARRSAGPWTRSAAGRLRSRSVATVSWVLFLVLSCVGGGGGGTTRMGVCAFLWAADGAAFYFSLPPPPLLSLLSYLPPIDVNPRCVCERESERVERGRRDW